jgi:plasmid maintenance system antidote protein VapI
MVDVLIRAKKLQVGAVAAELGLHRNSFREKVRGDRAFTEDEIIILARVLGVTEGDLFADPLQRLVTSESGSAWTNKPADQAEDLRAA